MADIVIINPRFEPSYWGMEHALPFMGKSANLPVACLPLLAALTPPEHTVTLIDENVEPIDWERCTRADIVGDDRDERAAVPDDRDPHRAQAARLLRASSAGPWITVQEDYFEGLADVIFIGEAEETWPQFLREWPQGLHQYRYEQAEKTDMTKVPTPRFDLLKMRRYAFGSLQFSRGCPFQCEFCDIIVTFGRRPRIKTSAQVIAELEAIWKTGLRIVFIVDDNLIGNKKAIKEVLRDVIAWQRKKGYPLTFFTEASIDLADDAELLDLMVRGQLHRHLHRHREPERGIAPRDQEVPERPRGGTLLEKVTGSRTPAWRSGAG